MEHIDNFPNGWKDGYSSADDPDRRLNDYAAESLRRSAAIEDEMSAARRARMNEIEERRRAKEEAERAKLEWQEMQYRNEIEESIKLRKKAVNILVEQKRVAYDKQSFLKKAVLKIKGRTFEQMKWKVVADARQKVDNMNDEAVKLFVEANERRKR